MMSRIFVFFTALLLSSGSLAASFLDNTCLGQKGLHFRHFTKFQFNDGTVTKYHENGTTSEDPDRYSSMTDFLIKRKVCREANTATSKINEAHKEILRSSLSTQNVLDNPCIGKKGMHYRRSQLFIFEKGKVLRYLDDGTLRGENRNYGSMSDFVLKGRVCLEAGKPSPAVNIDHTTLLKNAVKDASSDLSASPTSVPPPSTGRQ